MLAQKAVIEIKFYCILLGVMVRDCKSYLRLEFSPVCNKLCKYNFGFFFILILCRMPASNDKMPKNQKL